MFLIRVPDVERPHIPSSPMGGLGRIHDLIITFVDVGDFTIRQGSFCTMHAHEVFPAVWTRLAGNSRSVFGVPSKLGGLEGMRKRKYIYSRCGRMDFLVRAEYPTRLTQSPFPGCGHSATLLPHISTTPGSSSSPLRQANSSPSLYSPRVPSGPVAMTIGNPAVSSPSEDEKDQNIMTPDEKGTVFVRGIKEGEDLYEAGSIDPVYQAKARILNRAIQEIGMGKYQVCAPIASSLLRRCS